MSIGKLIVFEGVDDTGKTTHSQHLTAWLIANHIPAVWTCEPYSKHPSQVNYEAGIGGPAPKTTNSITSETQGLSLLIMNALQDCDESQKEKQDCFVSPMARALIWCADRAQHIDGFIKPHLKSGITVVTDRYIHSTGAYQVMAGDAYLKGKKHLWEYLITGLDLYKPDMSILLSANEQDVLEGFEDDRFTGSNNKREAWREANRYYKRVASLDGVTWREVLDSRGKTKEAIFDEILYHVRPQFGL